MCYTKDIAKVLTGAALVEILNRTVLTMANTPHMSLFGMIITPTYNLVILFGWIIIGAFSAYYAWFKKERSMLDRLKHPFTK